MSDAEVVLGADTSALTAGMQQASARVTAGFAEMKGAAESLKASMDSVTNSFRLFSEILIGGLIGERLLEITKHLAEYGDQVDRAAQKTGMSTDSLQQLAFAGNMTDVSFEALQLGMRKLAVSMTLAQQGSQQAIDAFKAVGISVADIKGAKLEDILAKIADKFSNSADGAGKMAVAQQLLGRAGSELIPTLNLGSEGLAKLGAVAKDMGLVIDEKGLKSLHDLDIELKLAHASATVLERQVATAFVPALTAMAQAFNDDVKQGGPFSTLIQMLARGMLELTGYAMKFAATIEAAGAAINGVGEAASEALKGNFKVAKTIMGLMVDDIDALEAKTNHSLDVMRGAAEKAASDIQKILDAAQNQKKKKEITPVSSKQTDRVAEWKNELEQRYEANLEFHKRDFNMEGEFWTQKLAQAKEGTKEYMAVQHQLYEVLKAGAKDNADADLAIMARESAAQKEDIQKRITLAQQESDLIAKMYGIGSARAIAAQGKVEALMREAADKRRAEADQQIQVERDLSEKRIQIQRDEIEFRAQMGQIGGDERITQLRAVLDEEYQMRSDALQKEYNLASTTEVEKQKLMDESAKLYGEYLVNVQKLNHDAALDIGRAWDGVFNAFETAFEQAAQGIAQGTQTLRQAMLNISNAIVGEFISMGVKVLASWVKTQLGLTLSTQEGVAARNASEMWGAITSIAIASWAAIKKIAIYAWEAFAGVYADVSEHVPYGWIVAPVLAGAAAATVIGVASNIMSAEGGYDIPAGVNPLVQAHQREMILPAKVADTIRNNMEDGGGGELHLHIHAAYADAQGIAHFFRDNGQHVAAALKQQIRDSNSFGYAPNT